MTMHDTAAEPTDGLELETTSESVDAVSGKDKRKLFALLGLVAIAALGLFAFSKLGDESSSRIEPFTYDVDRALVFADETTAAVFPEMSADALFDRWPDGLISRELTESLLVDMTSYTGRMTGSAKQLDHREWHDAPIDGLGGTFDIAEVRHEADFENGPGEIWLAVTEVDGEMRLISWRVLLDSDIEAAD